MSTTSNNLDPFFILAYLCSISVQSHILIPTTSRIKATEFIKIESQHIFIIFCLIFVEVCKFVCLSTHILSLCVIIYVCVCGVCVCLCVCVCFVCMLTIFFFHINVLIIVQNQPLQITRISGSCCNNQLAERLALLGAHVFIGYIQCLVKCENHMRPKYDNES